MSQPEVDRIIETMSPVQKDELNLFAQTGSLNGIKGAVKKALFHRGLWGRDDHGNPILTTMGANVLAQIKKEGATS
ncbi:hypothetical protein [Corynebacterium cystitidis]|uniref:hypothetical protein n=1 Tax=Corynebacterium cystitidis TaxID=35757 RepID=UPI00211F2C14|nr:hypothetical protein [Corynebacterium cystitidis]